MKSNRQWNAYPEHSSEQDNFTLIALGSNLGDRVLNIKHAIAYLGQFVFSGEVNVSSLYETQPVGVAAQPWFINSAMCGCTRLRMDNLIFILKSLEYFLGRRHRQRWHEREIDLDIIFYNNVHIDTGFIRIPHPGMHLRKFVLKPASEIAPDFIHPKLLKPVSQLLSECEDNSEIRLYE